MNGNDDVWAWLDSSNAQPIHTQAHDQNIEKCFARLFAHPDGAAVLAHLHAITRARTFGPDVSDTTLRYVEGQRALVAYMERMSAHTNIG